MTPVFNETFLIDVKNIADEMKIEVLDDDIGKDEKLGETTIKLSTLCVSDAIDTWIDVQSEGEVAGRIHLKSDWNPTCEEHAHHFELS